jgi:prepilin-type processing-associated H-X9-DG protein
VLHPELPPDQRLSWWVSILPYIEKQEVFEQFDPWRGAGDPRNERATSNRFRHFVCPASGECTYGNRGESWKSATPLTHYVGVAGVGPDAAALPLGHPSAGVFGHDRRTPLKDGIPDGKSNTLMLIETGMNPGHWAYGGTATVRAFEREPVYIGPGRPFGGFHDGPFSFFSPRDRLCNVAFADGSYRSLTDKTDPAVLEALATVGGREELPANW